MSQRVPITRVRHKGVPVYLGDEVTNPDRPDVRQPVWSSDPDRIAQWMAAGFRTRFNQRRSCRSKYLTAKDRDGVLQVVRTPDDEPVLVPIGSNVANLTDKQARLACSWLAAVPQVVLETTLRIEDRDWWAAIKRRQSLVKQGRAAGSMPGFRSRRDDATFAALHRGGVNAVYVRTGRKSGMVTISGMNPPRHRQPGIDPSTGKPYLLRWSLTFHVRIHQPIRDYTSVRVNLTRRELVFVNAPLPLAGMSNDPQPIGIDRGVVHTVADSQGRFYDGPDLRTLDRKRKAISRKMARSRCVAEREHRPFYVSKRYQAHKAELARVSLKMTRKREDFAHNLSAQLVRESSVIVSERLEVRNMTRRAKGKGRAAKAGLNRVMANAALGRLAEFLRYKAKLAGVEYVEVNPAYTSQECNKCGHTSRENRESQAVFLCMVCGHTANADTNAARNILNRFLEPTGDQVPGRGAMLDGIPSGIPQLR